MRAIAGAQSQEPRAGRLQVRARARGMTADRIEHARLEERSILRHWVMRMTVHLIPADDYGWMAPLFSERILRWSRRRLGALGVSDSERDRVLAAAERALGSGPVRRSEVMEIAARHGVEPNVQRRTHLAVLLVVGGAACIGPDAGRESTFVATGDWIGEPRKMDRERALAELARRYFRAFAPAGERDFASWSGLPLGECRSGIDAIAAELTELTAAGETLLAPKGWTARTPRSPIVRLLPAFDTYLMGYASRAHAVDDAGARRILPGGGILRPTICVDGRFVGLWSSKRGGNRLAVALEPFEELDEALSDAIAAEVADIGRFEGTRANLA